MSGDPAGNAATSSRSVRGRAALDRVEREMAANVIVSVTNFMAPDVDAVGEVKQFRRQINAFGSPAP